MYASWLSHTVSSSPWGELSRHVDSQRYPCVWISHTSLLLVIHRWFQAGFYPHYSRPSHEEHPLPIVYYPNHLVCVHRYSTESYHHIWVAPSSVSWVFFSPVPLHWREPRLYARLLQSPQNRWFGLLPVIWSSVDCVFFNSAICMPRSSAWGHSDCVMSSRLFRTIIIS